MCPLLTAGTGDNATDGLGGRPFVFAAPQASAGARGAVNQRVTVAASPGKLLFESGVLVRHERFGKLRTILSAIAYGRGIPTFGCHHLSSKQ